MGQIDRFPVKDLMGRYGIKRTALYNRLNSLGIESIKEGALAYVSGEDLQRLDRLDAEVKSSRQLPSPGRARTSQTGEQLELPEENAIAPVNSTAMMVEFVKALHPQREKIASFKDLAYLAAIEEMVPTSLVRELTGTTPKGEIYQWGRFEFIRSGRMGRETAWVVRRVSSSRHLLKTNMSSD